MADNVKYRFIQNVGDFFPAGYFGEDFIDKVQKVSGYSAEEVASVCSTYVQFRRKYDEYKNRIVSQTLRPKDSIRYTHEFHTDLLKLLGYTGLTQPYSEQYVLDEDKLELIPVRHVLRHNNKVQMLIMEMRSLIKVGDEEPAGLFEQQYDDESEPSKPSRFTASHWSEVFTMPEGYKISPAVVNKAVSRIFLMPEDRRPSYILMLAGNTVFLFDKEKWNRGCYLAFTLDDLFSQASISAFRKYYALFHMLLCKETLCPDGETILMDALVEDSYKNAYEVTKDLKEGVVDAVETLANEALWFWKHLPDTSEVYNPLKTIDYTDDTFEAEVKDDCLTIIYRLLFLFYAESRTELEILPVGDEVYEKGYSLEMLRDLEQVRLISEESKRGYFIDASLKKLFCLINGGHKEKEMKSTLDKSFRVRHIDSPLFDNSKLHHLADVKFRNSEWQKIICALSLSKKQSGRGRGRISYANLGINQLGSVYESLLAYRGFYAEEDYIEVHKAGHPEDGTFLVPYSRFDDFSLDEILHETVRTQDGTQESKPKILPKGTFVYRLNGRDRQKSASYYTPEVLTRSTVKYTLKGILEDVEANIEKLRQLKENGEDTSSWSSKALELLNLKILEPAMGAAAFQNEVINQVADAYLKYRQEEKRLLGHENTWRIEPDKYQDELQKVKAYIATKNVYGVDLNPTAIELGKLSLWLNVIHKDMETPFFGHRLALGNAVVGAWFKVFGEKDFYVRPKTYSKKEKVKLEPWWEHAPHKIHFNPQKGTISRKESEVYHFLLPDKGMLANATIKDIKDKAKEEKRAYDVAVIERMKNPSVSLPSKDTYNALERMKTILADWTKPITGAEVQRLRELSKKIDKLIVEFVQYQVKVDKLTANNFTVWGKPVYSEQNYTVESYKDKLDLMNTRNSLENAHHKLKVIMDYWCSLWFWEYKDADKLPTRMEYWDDIDRMLNVELQAKDVHRTKVSISDDGQLDMYDGFVAEDISNQDTEEPEVEIIEDKAMTQADVTSIMAANSGKSQFFTSPRIPVSERLAERYHFFHPMLEFLEVFWLRDGFDIICGNPPWLKLEFDEQGILSEKYPEVAIRKVSAPDARKMRDQMFTSSASLEAMYRDEENENAGSTAFMNAFCNYPLLIGQQTNLYKCVLENGFSMMSNSGFMGLLHPEGVYDDPKGQPLRREMYYRLHYHFQYQNTLKLFAEILHWTIYGTHVYGCKKEKVDFISISNVYHPNTVDSSFVHDGHGTCGGLKTAEGAWNTQGHKSRIIHITEKELRTLSIAFENGADWNSTKLVSIHVMPILNVLNSLANFPTHVGDSKFNANITVDLDETGAVNSGILRRETFYPSINKYEMVYNGPQIYVSNPCYKTPRKKCASKADFDTIDFLSMSDSYIARSNYRPLLPLKEFKSLIKGFEIGQASNGSPIFDDWIDYYKVGFRKMVSLPSERSLICAVLPRKTAHINGIISSSFTRGDYAVDMAGLCSSIVLDFFLKTIAAQNLTTVRLQGFPLGISNIYNNSLRIRTLMLNCLTTAYADLWHDMWNPEYAQETWAIEDPRLKPFDTLHDEWAWDIPLRNYFERRQALVEIDVISAMALGLTLEDLEMIYTIQFPVLQQNENDTWYDQKGNIVFTCSKGLTGVGLDRPAWNAMQGEPIKNNKDEIIAYKGASETYVHTIDPAKSELYGGQQVTYYAPYTKCDRIEDYRKAWAHFEKIFKTGK